MADAADYDEPPDRGAIRRSFDWMFRSRETGRVVLIQPLNLPLGIFLVAAVVRRLLEPQGTIGAAVAIVAFVSLMWWALDEIVRGVNPFRRILGAAVAAATLIGLLR